MPKEDWVVDLTGLGPTPQAAVRRLLSEFRDRGWKDRDGAALAVVRGLQDARDEQLAVKKAAQLVPIAFLRDNGIRRDEVTQLLGRLAGKRRATRQADTQ